MRKTQAFTIIIIWFALTFLSIQYVNSQTIPASIIRTPKDDTGFYLICEGECSYFNGLQLDNSLRFEYGYEAVNYMYNVINSKENAKLGPLTKPE